MINEVRAIEFRSIKRISPSQFYSMKSCGYKSLLAEAFEKEPLLPVSQNAYLGTALHKVLELIAKGDIKNEDDFNKRFDAEVKVVEETLKLKGYAFFVPLQKSVRNFGLKKVLIKKHLLNKTEQPIGKDVKFISEKWFESKDKLIGGKIDLIIEAAEEIEIIDFKTGSITQDTLDDTGETILDIKEEYKDQLKIYAFLYFENTGRFPTRLSLVDLAKQKFNVEFSESECSSIYQKAKQLLGEINDGITKGEFAANPNETNCKYCLYRPACSFFLEFLENNFSFSDISGKVVNVVKYHNGNVSVFIENGEKKITITGFQLEKYEELYNIKGCQIYVFNLRREAIESVYSNTRTTLLFGRGN